jgi:hypothetical protein
MIKSHSLRFLVGLCFLTAFANVFIVGCVTDPFDPIIPPMDTTGIIDTNTVDTNIVDTSSIPCDPDSIYFQQDVLPIIIANCSYTGCHDAATKEGGVDLTDFASTRSTGGVEPNDGAGSEFYQVLVEVDTTKRMPYNLPKLDDADIALLKKWIDQGALNLTCDDSTGNDTTIYSFTADIAPIFETRCAITGCHVAGSSVSPTLATYSDISGKADRVKIRTQLKTMPQAGATQLTQDEIDKIADWVDGGAPNN